MDKKVEPSTAEMGLGWTRLPVSAVPGIHTPDLKHLPAHSQCLMAPKQNKTTGVFGM